ncbi:substrate-binding domain-containing protein [Sphaerisporangium sp. NPDC051017]|uniref:substrate-binding domain-containing protein n=1 Tax=Sphaerisporangium sp. NPDC051017 TaxID=3154636 RepID=UPI00343E08E8
MKLARSAEATTSAGRRPGKTARAEGEAHFQGRMAHSQLDGRSGEVATDVVQALQLSRHASTSTASVKPAMVPLTPSKRLRRSAIFAGCDMQAFGVFEAARRAGLRVPDDLSVVGFDDLPLARSAWPTLTTVRQPLEEMAALATRMALDISRGETPETRRVELATDLVIRDSTAPPR